MKFTGVLPAMTTPFDEAMQVDQESLKRHATWLLANGCAGLVMLGSLGEGATLDREEKLAILKCAVETSGGKPVSRRSHRCLRTGPSGSPKKPRRLAAAA